MVVFLHVIIFIMKEKDFYRPVQNWIKKNLNQTAVVELKLVKGNRFRLSDMRPHQIDSLLACKHNSLVYKIPDAGFDQKPFDICYFNNTLAYIGVVFYEPRKKKNLYLIDIDVILKTQEDSWTESQLIPLSAFQVQL